jgi:hypothetical protein
MIMKNYLALLVIATSLTLISPALAQDEGGGGSGGSAFGIGAQAMLVGPAGASLTYDFGRMHADGLFYMETLGNDVYGFGGRLWLTVHEGSNSDLSVGGGAGIISIENQDDSIINIEGGAKVRIFVVPNVALSAVVGLGVLIDAPGDGIVITGQTTGNNQGLGFNAGFGFTYYFR